MKIEDITLLKGVTLKKEDYVIEKYTKNNTVHYEDDKCEGIDIILKGKLVAYSLAKNGSENIVFEFSEDYIIGANLLFATNNTYPMNIYCIENCIVLHIKKEKVQELLNNSNFALNFIKNISNNSQGMKDKITIYKNKTLRENILNYLAEESIEQNSNIIKLNISKKKLADYLGVQRPSLFRELKKMKDENIIVIENRVITIIK